MDDCLQGSEEFERCKDMLRLLGMEHVLGEYTNIILYEGAPYVRSVYTEDYAWAMAWKKYQQLNK